MTVCFLSCIVVAFYDSLSQVNDSIGIVRFDSYHWMLQRALCSIWGDGADIQEEKGKLP